MLNIWETSLKKLSGYLLSSPNLLLYKFTSEAPEIARFMGPTWGPPGSCRTQMGTMSAPWTLLSGTISDTVLWRHQGPYQILYCDVILMYIRDSFCYAGRVTNVNHLFMFVLTHAEPCSCLSKLCYRTINHSWVSRQKYHYLICPICADISIPDTTKVQRNAYKCNNCLSTWTTSNSFGLVI